MFRMAHLATGVMPEMRGPCLRVTRCFEPSVACHFTGPVIEDPIHAGCGYSRYTYHMAAGPQPMDVAAMRPGGYGAETPNRCEPGTWGPPYPQQMGFPPQMGFGPQMMPGAIPPFCNEPTNACFLFASHHLPCVWSCHASVFAEAGMQAPDPAAQLAALRQQLQAQLTELDRQQLAADLVTKPSTLEETDKLIHRLETALSELRSHRAALEPGATGRRR